MTLSLGWALPWVVVGTQITGCAGRQTRHDENLREPLVRRQGSQVSMRVARAPEGPRHLHRIPRLSEAPWEVP